MAARKKDEGMKEQILEAAFEMTKREDFDGFTTANISAAAGVSEGTLYNYFKDKKTLLVQLFQYVFDNYYKNLNDYLEPFDNLNDILYHLFDFHIKFFGKTSKIFLLLFVPIEKGIGPHSIFRILFPKYFSIVTSILESHRDEIKKDISIENFPFFIIGSIQMIVFRKLALGGDVDLTGAINELHAIVTNYLLKKEN
ncbi:MAG: TetR/AcrR family transcriptional regulator [Acidobacteria bacterium]|nr:TetR/AcrR family transcriptional regulator [Acidobacteriota bacterium]